MSLSPWSSLLALSLLACGGQGDGFTPTPESPSPTPQVIPEGLSLQGVTYILDWDTRDARPSEVDAGWTLTNDLGLTITLTEGYLVSNSLSLIPCDAVLSYKSAPDNHYIESDPSTYLTPYVEDLLLADTIALGPITFDTTDYCQAYYLAARIIDDGDNQPDHLDMTAISLTLRGRVQGADDAESTPFSVTTSFANATVADMAPTGGEAAYKAVVTVTRSLGTLFDGVDPRTMGEDELAWEIMTNLMADTTVSVDLE